MRHLRSHCALPTLSVIQIGLIARLFVLSAVTFLALGTLSALWDNPLFIRMTPAGAWEVAVLLSLSVLTGLFVCIRRPTCPVGQASSGGVVGFLGIACPTCNKLLMLLFGGELLLAYFEPARPYLAAAGVLMLAVATARQFKHTRHQTEPSISTSKVTQ